VIHEMGVSTHPTPVAVHADHGLMFTRAGWFTMEQKYETLSLAGSVTIVPAGVPHRPLAGEDLDYWLLGFSAGSFGFDEAQAIMRPFSEVRLGASPVVHLEEVAQARLQRWFEALAREAEGQNELTAEVQRSLITLILSEVSRAMPNADKDGQRSPLVATALRYIQRHSLSPISLIDVASAVGRTAPHVAAVVKSETGFTVGTWITSARRSNCSTHRMAGHDPFHPPVSKNLRSDPRCMAQETTNASVAAGAELSFADIGAVAPNAL
jgi:hypothetical protein